MPGFQVKVRHGLGRDNARVKLQSFSERIRVEYKDTISNVEERWTEHGTLEFSFLAMGFKIAGNALIHDDHVHLDGSLPFAAVMFRGTIEKQVEAKLREALDS